MKQEIELIKKIKSRYVPKIYDNGETSEFLYFVMDVLGPSLASLRMKQPNRKFKGSIVLLVARETLHVIEEIHNCGIVHRDIKPSNFMVRPHSPAPICLIDFGISKEHIDPKTKKPFPPVGGKFIGTSKYASPAAFRKQELGRKDDLWSWFYMVCEISGVKLPWTNNKDKPSVLYMKETYPTSELLRYLPDEFHQIFGYIKRLDYADKPDYKYIYDKLDEAIVSAGITYSGTEWKWLWEQDIEASQAVPRTPGDEVYDTFDPQMPFQGDISSGGGCCNVA